MWQNLTLILNNSHSKTYTLLELPSLKSKTQILLRCRSKQSSFHNHVDTWHPSLSHSSQTFLIVVDPYLNMVSSSPVKGCVSEVNGVVRLKFKFFIMALLFSLILALNALETTNTFLGRSICTFWPFYLGV